MPNPATMPHVFYHGARAWNGPPEVQRGRKGRTEHGPGIYLTTSYATAAKYAKGGGTVKRVSVDTNLGWLDDVRIPLADTIAFVRDTPRMRKKAEIIADLKRNADRLGVGVVGAYVLRNLAVNYDALVGDVAPAMAAFFVRHGADADVVETSSEGAQEDWLVLFNPAKIVSIDVVDKRASSDARHLPLVRKRR